MCTTEQSRKASIDNKIIGMHNLTIGKYYEVISLYNDDDGESFYKIIDDNGGSGGWYLNRFITMDELRNKKLEELLHG